MVKEGKLFRFLRQNLCTESHSYKLPTFDTNTILVGSFKFNICLVPTVHFYQIFYPFEDRKGTLSEKL
jgi:hypothetical protein